MSQSQQNQVYITPNEQGYLQAYNPGQEQSTSTGQYFFPQQQSKQYSQNHPSNMDSYYNTQQHSAAAYNQRLNQQSTYETPTPSGENITADSLNQIQNHTNSRQFTGGNQMTQMYPYSQNYAVQQTPLMEYPQGVFVQPGIRNLQNILGVYIKQKFETFESITGCETPNVYKVYEADANGKKISSKILFKCKEKSNCCSRNFLPGSARPFTMFVKNKQDNDFDSGRYAEDSSFLLLKRDFKCTFLCLARPKLDVMLIQQGANKLIGSIIQPFTFCEVILDILDSNGNIRFHILGESLCMPAIYCRNIPCRSCQEAVFLVTNPDRSILSYISKHTAGCIKQCVSDVSNFGVAFPLNSTPEEKALIMAAVIFLDYRYFEESPADKNDNSGQIQTDSNQIELQDTTRQRLSP